MSYDKSYTKKPGKALVIDTETTGLDPKVDRVIEVACALYDLELGSTIGSFSAVNYSETNPAEYINGLAVTLLRRALAQERVWCGVAELMSYADVVLAHQASFDKSFLEASPNFNCTAESLARDGLLDIRTIPWVCTKNHVEWPNSRKETNHLIALALSYDVALVGAHRAATDVDIICRILTRVKERGADLQELIGSAMAPRTHVVALVSYDERHLAKDAGFTWEPEKKRWGKDVTAAELENLKFKVKASK
jgi:DNA polymerase III subunit epsilon